MSFLLTWIAYLHSRGLSLTEKSGALVCSIPSLLTPGDVSMLAAHQEALLCLLERWEEKAAMLQYCDGYPRAEAERLAWEALARRDYWTLWAPTRVRRGMKPGYPIKNSIG